MQIHWKRTDYSYYWRYRDYIVTITKNNFSVNEQLEKFHKYETHTTKYKLHSLSELFCMVHL